VTDTQTRPPKSIDLSKMIDPRQFVPDSTINSTFAECFKSAGLGSTRVNCGRLDRLGRYTGPVQCKIHGKSILNVKDKIVSSRYFFKFCLQVQCAVITRFYHAMHCSAERGLAIMCRLSVCPSVRPSVTLVDRGHLG